MDPRVTELIEKLNEYWRVCTCEVTSSCQHFARAIELADDLRESPEYSPSGLSQDELEFAAAVSLHLVPKLIPSEFDYVEYFKACMRSMQIGLTMATLRRLMFDGTLKHPPELEGQIRAFISEGYHD